MKRKRLIFVAGRKGAGKSTVISCIASRGLYVTELDHHYKQLLNEGDPEVCALPPEEQWTDHIMRVVYEKSLQYLTREPIFFTGIYRMSEIAYLWEKQIPLDIVQVVAADKARHERILARKREGEEEITMQDILIKDAKRDGTWPGYAANNINTILSHATYTINNDGTLEALDAQVDKYLEDLRERGVIS